MSRALSPARISSIRLIDEHKKAEVFLKPEEVSLAIGKGGMNIRLATMLTEYQIEVFRDVDDNFDEEDIFLDEFLDEIEPWVIEILKGIGCDTAKNVLEIPRQELIKRTDLEEETVDDVIRVLSAEFDSEGDAEKSLKDSEAHESSDQESVSDAETNDEPLN
jgi:N utilization substance protein A